MTQDTGTSRPVSPVLTGTTANKDRTLLIADDDAAFRNRIARALELRGFIVTAVGSVAEALAVLARYEGATGFDPATRSMQSLVDLLFPGVFQGL